MARLLEIATRFQAKIRSFGFLAAVSVVVAILVIHLQPNRWTSGRDSKQPINFDPAVYDFGNVLQVQVIRHEFRLFNGSDTAVRVIAMQTTCSCTVVAQDLIGKTIQAHSAVLVPVQFDTGTRDGPATAEVIVELKTEGVNYKARAVLRAEVLSEFAIQPQSVDFGTLKPGEVATRTVVFRANQAKALKIMDARSAHKAFSVSMQEVGESNSTEALAQAIITFHAPREARRNSFSSILQFLTTNERVPTVTIPVRGRVSPDVEIIPDVLVFAIGEASGSSRIVVNTEHPSRVVTIMAKTTADGTDKFQTLEDKLMVSREWLLTHRRTLSNSVLANVQRIDVELEVREGTDRVEARSVSVQVKSL